ncbi:MAG: Hsp20/alpha crystallin family protein [Methanothrix sp.]
MGGIDKNHHFSARLQRHTHHVYARLLQQGLLRAARRKEGESMPENEFHGQRMVDVMEGKDGITIIAELFGVHVDDLLMNLEGDSLEITAGQLRKNVALPRPAKSIIMKSFKNGILELKLD